MTCNCLTCWCRVLVTCSDISHTLTFHGTHDDNMLSFAVKILLISTRFKDVKNWKNEKKKLKFSIKNSCWMTDWLAGWLLLSRTIRGLFNVANHSNKSYKFVQLFTAIVSLVVLGVVAVSVCVYKDIHCVVCFITTFCGIFSYIFAIHVCVCVCFFRFYFLLYLLCVVS